MMHAYIRLQISFLVLACGAMAFPRMGHAQVQFPQIELTVGIHRIEAEVASSFDTRAQGLMFRKSMPANHGMVFIFPEADLHCMWMRNTLIPLSVAFIDAKGRIINVEDMKPQTTDNHCASAPAAFALEMNAGWFKQRGIGRGFEVRGLEKAPAPR